MRATTADLLIPSLSCRVSSFSSWPPPPQQHHFMNFVEAVEKVWITTGELCKLQIADGVIQDVLFKLHGILARDEESRMSLDKF